MAVSSSLAGQRDQLNRLDGAAGDGDLGVTVALAAEAIAEIGPAIAGEPPSDALLRLGTEIARHAPSTSGTLVAFAFMAAGRVGEVDGEPGAQAIAYLEAAEGSIRARGKVTVGDRTMLDALAPAVGAFRSSIDQGATTTAAAQAAAQAANEGAIATATMTATVGRSACLGDRARGHEDAGARLVAMAFEAAAGHLDRTRSDPRQRGPG